MVYLSIDLGLAYFALQYFVVLSIEALYIFCLINSVFIFVLLQIVLF